MTTPLTGPESEGLRRHLSTRVGKRTAESEDEIRQLKRRAVGSWQEIQRIWRVIYLLVLIVVVLLYLLFSR